MTGASNALRTLLEELGMGGALSLGRITGRWDALFRGPLSKHTSPETLNGSTLTVCVDSPSWLQEANFHKAGMLGKLAPLGVRSMRFRLGRVRPTAPAPAPEPVVREVMPGERQEVEAMLAAVKDDELRESIRSAVLRSLSRAGRTRH